MMGLSPRRIPRGGPQPPGADERTSRASSHLARSSSAPQRANSTESGGPRSGIRSLDQGVERCNSTRITNLWKPSFTDRVFFVRVMYFGRLLIRSVVLFSLQRRQELLNNPYIFSLVLYSCRNSLRRLEAVFPRQGKDMLEPICLLASALSLLSLLLSNENMDPTFKDSANARCRLQMAWGSRAPSTPSFV